MDILDETIQSIISTIDYDLYKEIYVHNEDPTDIRNDIAIILMEFKDT